ncbi:MAG: hypothetical protein ACYDCL_15135 [Myxococcales bacterium]
MRDARSSRSGFAGALALAAALWPLACSDWGEDGLARLDQLHPPPAPAAPANGSSCALPDRDGGSAAGPSSGCLGLLSGQWAGRLVQFAAISPIGPPAWNLTITDLFLAQLSSDKGSLDLTFCGEESSLTDDTGAPQTLGQNAIPAALVSALAAAPLAVPLPGDGTLQASGVVWLWGLQGLTAPATDPLPSEPDAGTVWDQDGDGEPGVTVDVIAPPGELYLVKRAVFDFEQGSVAQGWVTGPLQFRLDQEVLGATSSLLDATVPITPRGGCTSVYQFECVDPGFTCTSLVQSSQTLFSNAPH